jgi:hypothetical protein
MRLHGHARTRVPGVIELNLGGHVPVLCKVDLCTGPLSLEY